MSVITQPGDGYLSIKRKDFKIQVSNETATTLEKIYEGFTYGFYPNGRTITKPTLSKIELRVRYNGYSRLTNINELIILPMILKQFKPINYIDLGILQAIIDQDDESEYRIVLKENGDFAMFTHLKEDDKYFGEGDVKILCQVLLFMGYSTAVAEYYQLSSGFTSAGFLIDSEVANLTSTSDRVLNFSLPLTINDFLLALVKLPWHYLMLDMVKLPSNFLVSSSYLEEYRGIVQMLLFAIGVNSVGVVGVVQEANPNTEIYSYQWRSYLDGNYNNTFAGIYTVFPIVGYRVNGTFLLCMLKAFLSPDEVQRRTIPLLLGESTRAKRSITEPYEKVHRQLQEHINTENAHSSTGNPRSVNEDKDDISLVFHGVTDGTTSSVAVEKPFVLLTPNQINDEIYRLALH